jgi:RNA polymerase sigma-70 factor (ECF subfamily)
VDAGMMETAELTECFDQHWAGLVLYARQWLGRGAAEDVVQEAFVRLMLAHPNVENVRAWLYRATRNLAIAQWRSAKRRRQREAVAAREEPVFEESFEHDSRVAARCLSELPREQREVIVLRIWGQLKLAEISAVTGLGVSSVFHQYQQGLREIRRKMGVPCQNHD